MKLYDIPAEIDDFERRLEESGGELTPEFEQEWKDFISGSCEKLEAAAFILNRIWDDHETCRKESRRIQGRAQRFERNHERLSELTLYALQALGGKIKTSLISMHTGRTGKQINVEVKEGTDLEKVSRSHPGLVRVKYEANLDAIKEAYVGIATKVDAERERLKALVKRDGSMVAEQDVEPQVLAFWKELLLKADLPDCFIVRNQAPTEYLVIK